MPWFTNPFNVYYDAQSIFSTLPNYQNIVLKQSSSPRLIIPAVCATKCIPHGYKTTSKIRIIIFNGDPKPTAMGCLLMLSWNTDIFGCRQTNTFMICAITGSKTNGGSPVDRTDLFYSMNCHIPSPIEATQKKTVNEANVLTSPTAMPN